MIEIREKEPQKCADIALLVDNKAFIQLAIKQRKEWKIDELFDPIKPEEFVQHLSKIYGEDVYTETKKAVAKIRSFFNIGSNFDPVIKYAVCYKYIPDGVYKTVYFKVFDEYSEIVGTEYALVVTPDFNNNDLKKAKNEFVDLINTKRLHKNSTIFDADYNYDIGYFRDRYKQRGKLDKSRFLYWLINGQVFRDETNQPLTISSKNDFFDYEQEYFNQLEENKIDKPNNIEDKELSDLLNDGILMSGLYRDYIAHLDSYSKFVKN